MKKTLTEYEFCREWETNETRKDQFSHSAQVAMYEYFTQYEEETGEDIELDIVAICCEYVEYGSAWEAMQAYQPEDMPVIDLEPLTDADGVGPDLVEVEELQEAAALEWLQERTTVIPFDGTIVLSDGIILGNNGVVIASF